MREVIFSFSNTRIRAIGLANSHAYAAYRITGVNREEQLRASHCKPWRDASIWHFTVKMYF
jgi:hypothetical protein|tara:strand:- start:90953 stop:91135 length:183 start_codon:yes stop_codon:yes gene_type:complete